VPKTSQKWTQNYFFFLGGGGAAPNTHAGVLPPP